MSLGSMASKWQTIAMGSAQMLRDVLVDERGWKTESIDDPAAWYSTLSDTCLAELDAFVQELKDDPQPVTEVRIQKTGFASCRACLQPVAEAVDSGRGFAIIDRLPLEHYSVEEAQTVYWLVGQMLGLPFEQDVKGTLLYDVQNTGQDVREGARFSVTNAESSFHTDGAFNPQVADFVGLLCLQTAKSGGESQLISAVTLHNELLQRHPDVLETLYEPFYFDRRGQFRDGEPPVSETPIFRWDGQALMFRYLYYYIQVGHESINRPLTPQQEKALDVLESLIRRENLRVEFSLEPGQILFTNNGWILHNRTAFEDYVEIDKRRHYVRLWLSRET